MSPSASSAAERLRLLGPELAREVVDRQYAYSPELRAKFGERGYRKSVEDAVANLEHLAEAAALESPETFASYIRWLRTVLEAAGVSVDVLREHLVIVAQTLAERCPEHAAAWEPCLAAGRAALV